jgi:WD40 repeat protein
MGGPVLVRLRGYQGSTTGVAFSPDGQQIASSSFDATVRVWTCEVCGPIEEVLALAEQRITRELTCEEQETFLHEPCRS